MAFKVIDNRKVDMTDEEYNEYIQICRSYDRPHFKGEELFKNLFETNEDGRITYIKSFGHKQLSFEVMLFSMNLMQNQWLRLTIARANEALSIYQKKMEEKLAKLDEKMSSM